MATSDWATTAEKEFGKLRVATCHSLLCVLLNAGAKSAPTVVIPSSATGSDSIAANSRDGIVPQLILIRMVSASDFCSRAALVLSVFDEPLILIGRGYAGCD
jgi:hypothetical protein